MKKRKKLMVLLVAGIMMLIGSFAVKANDGDESSSNGNTYRHVMIYNHTSRNVTLFIKNYRSDFKHTPPYFIYNGNRIEKYVEGIKPGEHAELKWDDRFFAFKTNEFNLYLSPWMRDTTAFTDLDLRIKTERSSNNKGYISGSTAAFNKELGEIAANGIVYTHKEVYDKNSFHEDIVRKMGLDPNRGFGIFMKYAIGTGMKYIDKKSPFPSCAPTMTHYYYTTCITDSVRMYYGDLFQYLEKHDFTKPYQLNGMNI